MPRPSDSASSAPTPIASAPTPTAAPNLTAIATLFRQGLALHQRGDVGAAKLIYERVLAAQPLHFDALHLLGVVAYQRKELQQAADLMERAMAINPQHAPCHSNCGLTLQHLQRLDEALLHYDRALALQPDFADAHHNRGIALKLLGRLEEALLSMDAALAVQPDFADCLGNRGTVLQELGRMEEALASYDRALALAPHSAHAQHNRGTQLEKMQRYPEALVHYAQAIALQPNHHEAWTGQGNCHEKLHHHQQALASYAQAIAVKPDHALAHYNRGNVLVNLMRHSEAIASYEQAIAIQPDYASAWWNKAINLLVQGHFAEGFALYEWRWKGDARSLLRNFAQPLWLGAESLAGKTILLHAEQGLGDSIQFCRYASQLSAQGARVLLEVPQPLVQLLGGRGGLDGVSAVIEQGAELPPFDCHCPLLSLPLACKTQLHSIPAAPRYLSSDPGKRQAWSERLGQKTRPRIGLVWSGNAAHSNDRRRSMALVELRPYLPAGFDYVSLQTEVRSSDQRALQGSGIRQYAEHLHDFSDTAALVDLLDLVISVDTSVAHLCGALGKTTLLLLPYIPDWRWLLEREDSAWYPSLRLLRQGADRQWAPVLQRLAPLLQIALAHPGQQRVLTQQEMARAVPQGQADSYIHLGNQFRQGRNFQQALASYDQALARQPAWAQAWYSRGLVLDDLGRHAEALDSYDKAIALQHDYAAALHRRGTALQLLGRPQEALVSLDAALVLKPDSPECHDHRGTVLYNLQRMDEALASYDRALALAPAAALIHYNRGAVLENQKRHEQALACYERVIALKPDHAQAWMGAGTAQQELQRFEDAFYSLQKAIALQPDHAPAHFNLGNLLQSMVRHSQAIASYDRAIALQPDYASAYWNKSIALLQTGQWESGWELHEWRWQRAPASMRRHFQQPLWLGGPDLAGKTILLYAEQGLGDCIQFCRYTRLVKAKGARVLLQVPDALRGLMRGVEGVGGVDAVLDNQQPLPDFDCQCPLLSLPLAFQTRPGSIPAAAGYLHSDAALRQHWSQRLGQHTRPRIGLVWSGNAEHNNDRFRSIPLATLCQHLPAGLDYVSLQKEVRSSDRAALAASGIHDASQHIRDFADTAALLDLMDLVVCVDTSVAHLAGALGKTTWLLLPYVPDWRWLLGRADTPWYASLTLLRQGPERQWDAVLQNLATRLQELAGRMEAARVEAGAVPSPQPLPQPLPSPQSLDTVFQQGLALHQQGQFTPALACYAQVLAGQPQHFDALHLRGLIAYQTGNPALAVEQIGQALQIKPQIGMAHQHQALALQDLGRLHEALAHYQRATQLEPGNAQFHYQLAGAYRASQQLEQAVAACQQCLALQADHAKALHLLGLCQKALGQWQAALSSYARALALRPDFAECHCSQGVLLQSLNRLDDALHSYNQAIATGLEVAQVYFNRGTLLEKMQRHPDALCSYEQAIARQPEHHEAWTGRGNVLEKLQRPTEALHSFDQALARQPNHAPTWTARGYALARLGQHSQAIAHYQRALSIQPDYALAHSNRGHSLAQLLRLTEALDSYNRALALEPGSAGTHWNKSLALLQTGAWEEGWPLYEWGWQEGSRGVLPRYAQPQWRGAESLAGKTLLLYAEQGLGDTIQFCRYAPLLQKLGGRVLLQVPRPLVGLLQSLTGVASVMEQGGSEKQNLPDFDYHSPLLSLPLACKTGLHNIPAETPYLHSQASKRQAWLEQMGAQPGTPPRPAKRPRIGLVWSGNAEHNNDRNRSLPLAQLLAALPPGFDYVSLQKEVRSTDQAAFKASKLYNCTDQLHDFADTAALIDVLDLVISVDTSVAHLSAALGKPTWLLLPFAPDWRWLLERSDSPWYPTMRLFRQTADCQWQPVLQAVAAAIAGLG
ncbi:MAG: tetratricopeptide repeat protein [Rhodoferax sp.]|nr:tetratricopeptide repeat protein [Rhodoferax sp.]